MTKQTKCKRCGTCCRQGGPALHEEDRSLIGGRLKFSDLITIRKDELVHSPLSGRVEQAAKEFLKISGQGRSWACKFYDPEQSSCTIHAWRPLECRELKCWDTGDIEKIIYQNVLDRFDLLEPQDRMIPHVSEHEEKCPWQRVNELVRSLSGSGQSRELDELIKTDLAIRSRVIAMYGLSVDEELFYFGRPIFQLVEAMRRHK